MDRALSFLISAGIAAYGVWIIAYTMASGSQLDWTLMGGLPIMVGSISLVRQSVKLACVELLTRPAMLFAQTDEMIERVRDFGCWHRMDAPK
jgi:hypothetical protein